VGEIVVESNNSPMAEVVVAGLFLETEKRPLVNQKSHQTHE
jgi:hypothetical protein